MSKKNKGYSPCDFYTYNGGKAIKLWEKSFALLNSVLCKNAIILHSRHIHTTASLYKAFPPEEIGIMSR